MGVYAYGLAIDPQVEALDLIVGSDYGSNYETHNITVESLHQYILTTPLVEGGKTIDEIMEDEQALKALLEKVVEALNTDGSFVGVLSKNATEPEPEVPAEPEPEEKTDEPTDEPAEGGTYSAPAKSLDDLSDEQKSKLKNFLRDLIAQNS